MITINDLERDGKLLLEYHSKPTEDMFELVSGDMIAKIINDGVSIDDIDIAALGRALSYIEYRLKAYFRLSIKHASIDRGIDGNTDINIEPKEISGEDELKMIIKKASIIAASKAYGGHEISIQEYSRLLYMSQELTGLNMYVPVLTKIGAMLALDKEWVEQSVSSAGISRYTNLFGLYYGRDFDSNLTRRLSVVKKAIDDLFVLRANDSGPGIGVYEYIMICIYMLGLDIVQFAVLTMMIINYNIDIYGMPDINASNTSTIKVFSLIDRTSLRLDDVENALARIYGRKRAHVLVNIYASGFTGPIGFNKELMKKSIKIEPMELMVSKIAILSRMVAKHTDKTEKDTITHDMIEMQTNIDEFMKRLEAGDMETAKTIFDKSITEALKHIGGLITITTKGRKFSMAAIYSTVFGIIIGSYEAGFGKTPKILKQ